MKKSLVALSIAGASLLAVGCGEQSGRAPMEGSDYELPVDTLGGGPSLPNGASPACLADPNVRLAIGGLAAAKVTAGGIQQDGTYLLPHMPGVSALCRHVIKDIVECGLGEGQVVKDQENGDLYEGHVGLAKEWEGQGLTDSEKRWVSACMIQRLNYFGISIPILLEGDKAEVAIDPELRKVYPFAESTAWGDIFSAGKDNFAWICTEEDVWSVCPRDLGKPWVDTRVCDGVQNCGIAFAGKCSDKCTLTAAGYWDCSANYGYKETIRVQMQTNAHPAVVGPCE